MRSLVFVRSERVRSVCVLLIAVITGLDEKMVVIKNIYTAAYLRFFDNKTRYTFFFSENLIFLYCVIVFFR